MGWGWRQHSPQVAHGALGVQQQGAQLLAGVGAQAVELQAGAGQNRAGGAAKMLPGGGGPLTPSSPSPPCLGSPAGAPRGFLPKKEHRARGKSQLQSQRRQERGRGGGPEPCLGVPRVSGGSRTPPSPPQAPEEGSGAQPRCTAASISARAARHPLGDGKTAAPQRDRDGPRVPQFGVRSPCLDPTGRATGGHRATGWSPRAPGAALGGTAGPGTQRPSQEQCTTDAVVLGDGSEH